MICGILIARSIGGVPVDVVMKEQHSAELEIAEHPVEKGAKISDHAWRKPRAVIISGLIAKPLAMAGFAAFHRLQEEPEPFALVTGLKVYDDMLLKRLEAIRDEETGRLLSFDAHCQEVIIVNTRAAAGGQGGGTPSESANNRAAQTSARGAQGTRTQATGGVSPDTARADAIAAPYL